MKRSRIITRALVTIPLLFLISCGESDQGGSFTGLVEGRVYSLASPVSDRLAELSVAEGDAVAVGESVGRIDSSALELQRKALGAKAAQLDLQLQELRLNSAQVEDTRDFYLDTYRKNLELLKVQAVSDQSVRDLKLNADKWERELATLRLKQESLLRQQEEIGYKLDEMDLMIDKARITSPVAGYVDRVYFELGEYVPALRPVVELVNLEKVWCYLYLGEEQIGALSPGQALEASSGEHRFAARVEHINSRAEFTPSEVLTDENRAALAYAVRVGIENPDGILKIGMPVEINW